MHAPDWTDRSGDRRDLTERLREFREVLDELGEHVESGPRLPFSGKLSQIFCDNARASRPTYHHPNAGGDFTFRAQWLDQDDPAAGLIGITISHMVPLPIRLIRGIKRLPLSRRQAQICMLMATGASTTRSLNN